MGQQNQQYSINNSFRVINFQQYQKQEQDIIIIMINKNNNLLYLLNIANPQMSVFKTANMEYRKLGNTGLKVSVLSFGNMINYKPENQEIDDTLIKKCLENGINYFDTAEMYANGECQKALGRAIKKSGVQRADIIISTKIWVCGTNINAKATTNRKHVIEGLNASLQRLQLDHVDILFAHSFDVNTSVEQTCRAFNYVLEEGKAFYWATSNWDAENIFQAFQVCDRLGLIRPIADQLQYNMLVRKTMEVDFQRLFDKYNYGTTVWSPLAGGFLTGKYLDSIPENTRISESEKSGTGLAKQLFYNPHMNEKIIKALKELEIVAKDLGFTLAQLALAWVLKNKDASTAITGARNLQQLEDNLRAVDLYRKIDHDLEVKINRILDNTPTPKSNFAKFIEGNPRRPI